MSSITESIDVEVDVSTAYNQWTQFESFPTSWRGSTRSTRSTTPIPIGLSARPACGGSSTPRSPSSTRTSGSPGALTTPEHAGVVTFHRLSDTTTRVTAQLDIDPDGFVENVADKLGILNRRIAADMTRFKTFIESRGGTETGAWRGDVDRPGTTH